MTAKGIVTVPDANKIFKGPSAKIASEHFGRRVPLQVLQSEAGFYLGFADEGGPVSRESMEYWPAYELAEEALQMPDSWTQRENS